MVLPYLKGFLYFLCSVFGEWFGLFLLILWVYFEIYLQILPTKSRKLFINLFPLDNKSLS
jgi:hypothetical protein